MPHIIPSRLVLPAPLADAIRGFAAAEHPNECCGLLVGEGSEEVWVLDVIPTPNVAADPTRGFAVDPQIQFELLRSLRGGPRRIVGHYHSHPTGNVLPSAQDLAMAHDPEVVWVLAAGGTLRAYVRPVSALSFVDVLLVEFPGTETTVGQS